MHLVPHDYLHTAEEQLLTLQIGAAILFFVVRSAFRRLGWI
jgi:hypothetical protein